MGLRPPMLFLWQNFPAKASSIPDTFTQANGLGVLNSCQNSGAWQSVLQKLQTKVQHGKGRDFAKLAPQCRYGLLRFLCVALFEQRLDDTDFARCLVYGSRDLEEGGKNVFDAGSPGKGCGLLRDIARLVVAEPHYLPSVEACPHEGRMTCKDELRFGKDLFEERAELHLPEGMQAGFRAVYQDYRVLAGAQGSVHLKGYVGQNPYKKAFTMGKIACDIKACTIFFHAQGVSLSLLLDMRILQIRGDLGNGCAYPFQDWIPVVLVFLSFPLLQIFQTCETGFDPGKGDILLASKDGHNARLSWGTILIRGLVFQSCAYPLRCALDNVSAARTLESGLYPIVAAKSLGSLRKGLQRRSAGLWKGEGVQYIFQGMQDDCLAGTVHAEKDIHALREVKLKIVKRAVVFEVYAGEQHDPSPWKRSHVGEQASWKEQAFGRAPSYPWGQDDTTGMKSKGRMSVPRNKFEQSNAQTVVRESF